jgi:hypothetical protein
MRLAAKCALAAIALLLAAPVLLAQNTTTTPAPPFPTPLYRMNDVAKTLTLTPDQINRLNQATTDLQTRYARDYTTIQNLKDPDLTTRTQDWLRNYSSGWNNAARDIFNERQMNRYNELWRQYHGFNTFTDPDLQERFKLTEQQRTQLREGIDWSNSQLRSIYDKARTDPAAATTLYNQYWKDRHDRLYKILTPDQQRIWGQMIGEPYNFQPNFPQR